MIRFMTTTERMFFAAVAIAIALFALWSFTGITPQALGKGKPEKVTICHAAGLAGTTKFVTLTLPWVAVYGQAGHFNENGTTRAGHEQDYLGACDEEEPPVDPEDPPVDPEEPPVTPEDPKPVLCPDGLPPTPGEGAFDPNDDCARAPKEEPSTPSVPETPTTPPSEPSAPPVAPSPEPSPTPEQPGEPTATPSLEEELEEQAKANGATPGSAPDAQPAAQTLPYTGLPLGLWFLVGSALTGAGAWLRRRP